VRFSPRFGDLAPAPFFRQWRLLAGNLASGMGSLLPVHAFPILVVALLDAEHNAYYFIAWSVSAAFFMISPAVSHALLAEVSTSRAAQRQIRMAAVAIFVLLVPATTLAILLARPLLGLFGPEYAEHGTSLVRIYAVAAFPDAITNIYVAVLLARRRVSRAAVVNLVMGAVAVVGAAVTLPLLGIDAVGWSWLCAQVLGVLMMLFFLRRGDETDRQPRDSLERAQL
jgi:O-antigen/teichoic acid export membrane protein